MIGYDDNCISCPVCKTFKNTWQPFLPLGLRPVDPSKIDIYVDYCSQLHSNHMNSPRSILAVDIKADPKGFVQKMISVVTHMVMESTCMRN